MAYVGHQDRVAFNESEKAEEKIQQQKKEAEKQRTIDVAEQKRNVTIADSIRNLVDELAECAEHSYDLYDWTSAPTAFQVCDCTAYHCEVYTSDHK